jgi:DNA-binding transcriptional LysR family regulator
MELRHLRYFIAVAEELHFARAAERLHIEQSPLSRAIKDLEYDLGLQLFERTTRSTRLTWAGQVFLDESRHVLSTLEQAVASTKTAATGYRGTLRIALSDGIAQPRLSSLLAQCREEEPDVEIRLFDVPLAEQVKGLRGGFAGATIYFSTLFISIYLAWQNVTP